MTAPKKELEIVYNLQWKNTPNKGDDKASIIGMQDIPATTLTWDGFKSYLLKNSGVSGDDVEVSYIDSHNKEFRIDSQMKFQIAMYSFRQRARNGEIITLKLDRISSHNEAMYLRDVKASPTVHDKAQSLTTDEIPAWFDQYMKQFKQEIKEESTAAVLNALSNSKIYCSHQAPSYLLRKSKVDFTKRPRKTMGLNLVEANERDINKTLTIERKLDSKLEKLERKAFKIREKKSTLTRSDDGDISCTQHILKDFGMIGMDAVAVKQFMITTRVDGGDVYQQEWEVVNSGISAWTSDTELRYAWGSECLKPLTASVPCPRLQPGEQGSIAVYIQVPVIPGLYECYWHFLHAGCRFGNWLGCRIIVNPPKPKLINSGNILPMFPASNEIAPNRAKKLKTETLDCFPLSINSDSDVNNQTQECLNDVVVKTENVEREGESGHVVEECVQRMADLSSTLEHLGIAQQTDAVDSTSDSDNQSIVSLPYCNSTAHSASSDFEFIQAFQSDEKVDECSIKVDLDSEVDLDVTGNTSNDEDRNTESDTKDDHIKNETSELNTTTDDNNHDEAECTFKTMTITKPKEMSELAYVYFEGQKYPVPKYLLRDDYLQTAENAPAPKQEEVKNLEPLDCSKPKKTPQEDEIQLTTEPTLDETVQPSTATPYEIPNLLSSPRVFVFPSKTPGFECVTPSSSGNSSGAMHSSSLSPSAPTPPQQRPPWVRPSHLHHGRFPGYGHPGVNNYGSPPHRESLSPLHPVEPVTYSVTVNHHGCGYDPATPLGHSPLPFFPPLDAIERSIREQPNYVGVADHRRKTRCAVDWACSTARSLYHTLAPPTNDTHTVYVKPTVRENSGTVMIDRARALEILREMGFPSLISNETALNACNNDLEAAVDYLVAHK